MTGGFGALTLANVTKTFGGYTAVDGLDLTISGGEFVALLGPSGCGKSTALNLVAGLLAPTSGSLWLDEHRIDTVPTERRDFGMVFQNYALFPHLTVAENVAFGLRLRRVRRAERTLRVREALDLVQLADQADKRPGELSGGQQQRVAVARAVVTRPQLVLMDEPLSNLDAQLRLDMRTEIRSLHQELGLTTVYVTHDQVEALSLADRLVVMRAGVAQQIDTPEQVYEHPANGYVAAFVGYRNALPGRLCGRSAAGHRIEVAGVELLAEDSGLPADGDATVMIRPEDLVVTAEGDAAGHNLIPLTVRVCEYQGRHFAVEACTADGTPVHCHTERPLAPGEHVAARARPDRLRVFTGHRRVVPDEAELLAAGEAR